MLYLLIKAALSGVVIAVASEVARRWPGWGALTTVGWPVAFIFWTALAAGCALTIALYLATVGIGPKLGLKL